MENLKFQNFKKNKKSQKSILGPFFCTVCFFCYAWPAQRKSTVARHRICRWYGRGWRADPDHADASDLVDEVWQCWSGSVLALLTALKKGK